MLGEGYRQKARGAQENLWPKFILKNAPLRATSSVGVSASAVPSPKVVKLKKPGETCPVVIARWLESFTFEPTSRLKCVFRQPVCDRGKVRSHPVVSFIILFRQLN
jgi:hypothetical protein